MKYRVFDVDFSSFFLLKSLPARKLLIILLISNCFYFIHGSICNFMNLVSVGVPISFIYLLIYLFLTRFKIFY